MANITAAMTSNKRVIIWVVEEPGEMACGEQLRKGCGYKETLEVSSMCSTENSDFCFSMLS